MNPWIALPESAPFVLPADAAVIERFNCSAPEPFWLRLDLLPEPFVGRQDAPVVLLALNPGFSDSDPGLHGSATFAASVRKNIRHDSQAYPFYLLDPSNKGPGYDWWRQRLRLLLEEFGAPLVSRSLLCVEYFPYHSRRYAHAKLDVPSQSYARQLVHAAVQRDAVVIVMRGWNLWREAVPALENARRCFRLRSVQNVSVTPKNCPDGFAAVREVLQGELRVRENAQ
jgi:hypothetical protein